MLADKHRERELRTVWLINSHPTSKELCEELDRIRVAAEEHITFLKKQAENETEKARRLKKPLWDSLKSFLKEQNAIPQEAKDHDGDWSISFDLKNGAIHYKGPECNCGMCMIKGALGINQ